MLSALALLDALVDVAAGPAVTRLGDIWQIGSRRLICADSTAAATYEHLIGDDVVDERLSRF